MIFVLRIYNSPPQILRNIYLFYNKYRVLYKQISVKNFEDFPKKFNVFCKKSFSYFARSLITSPARISPATDGTKATEPGTDLFCGAVEEVSSL